MTLIVTDAKGHHVGFSMLNIFGQTIQNQTSVFCENDLFQAIIDAPNLPDGTYWARVQNGEKITFQKIFIVK